MKHTRTLMAITLLLAVAAACYGAQPPTIQKMLPTKSSVKGFAILPDSLQYGKGNDISKIYDGGFELYTKAGVVDAARQMYHRDSDYVEVTLHTMKSPQAALTFLKHWQKEFKAKKLAKSGKMTSFVSDSPNVLSYFVVGKYFGTVSAFYAADKARKDVAAFTNVIAKSLGK